MRRRAIIPIDEQFLEGLLKLPEGTKIHGFASNMTRMAIDVYVEGPAFDEVPEAIEAPVINPVYVSMYPYYSMVPMSGDTPIYDEVMNDLQRLQEQSA